MGTNANSQFTLQDDFSGRITRVAMQIEDYLFEAKHADKKAAYEALLQSFGIDIKALILVDDGAMATKVKSWLGALSLDCTWEPVGVEGCKVSQTGAWMRDALLNATQGGSKRYLRPVVSKMHPDQAEWLHDYDGTAVVMLPDIALDGGDSIVAKDFRLVGNQAIRATCEIAGHQCDYAQALARFAGLDERPFFPVGYRPSAIKHKWLWFVDEVRRRLEASRARTSSVPPPVLPSLVLMQIILKVLEDLLEDNLVEYWGHIDLVVSITNQKDKNDADILLVAKTDLSANPGDDELRESERLEALAIHLRSLSFHVIQNPCPFNLSQTRTLWYNNVIIQSDPKFVWLPQFADANTQYRKSDDLNAEIWRRLGYTVVPVPGWMAYVGSEGSIRCATQVLDRV